MLQVKNLSFSYTESPLLQDISFILEQGENLSIIGESGCGKSTLLQAIFGLHDVQGEIFWNEKKLLGPQFNIVPGEEFIKYLPQDFDLMPFISVAENVGKHLSNIYPQKKKKRIQELLEMVEMADFKNVKAKNLSGGQMQRVALAKVLAKEPDLILLDEPFAHIDHFRKNDLRRRLFSYLKSKNIACIVATHDKTDALSFADKTIVLRNGKIVAEGNPQKIYYTPKNAYVASLFGEINEIPVHELIPFDDKTKTVILYPHELKSGRSGLEVKVISSYFKGSHYLIEAESNDKSIFFENKKALPDGRILYLKVSEKLLKTRLS
ncbi:MAG TPA: ABC transporter ATP-binding protein [Salinimicrobium sp.]|nr:ABC transporter ATP-binding protein [Salinimicrobium sp.]